MKTGTIVLISTGVVITGITATYFLHEGFKEWVNNLLGIGEEDENEKPTEKKKAASLVRTSRSLGSKTSASTSTTGQGSASSTTSGRGGGAVVGGTRGGGAVVGGTRGGQQSTEEELARLAISGRGADGWEGADGVEWNS